MGTTKNELKKDQFPSKPPHRGGLFKTHGDRGPYPHKAEQKTSVKVTQVKAGGKKTLVR